MTSNNNNHNFIEINLKIQLKNNNIKQSDLGNIKKFDYIDNKNSILNNERQNNDGDNIFEIINGEKKINCCKNRNTMYIQNRFPNKRIEYENIIENRRNYQLYISSENKKDIIYNNDNNLNHNYYNTLKHFFNKRHFKNSPSIKSYKDYYNSHQDNNSNSKKIINNRERNKNSSDSNKRNRPFFICNSNPIKRIYKSPYNLKEIGIIKDNLYGQFYKVFQAIPIDFDESNQINYNQNFSPEKENIINTNNFYIYSNDINNNIKYNNKYIFQNPILKKSTCINSNKNINSMNNSKIKKRDKSLYLNKKFYISNCKDNLLTIQKEGFINKYNLKQIKPKENNNIYIEINESNRNENKNL